jgi:hypothetical protein
MSVGQDELLQQLIADGEYRQPAYGCASYDFALNGGATGDISLGLKVPANVIIYTGFVYVRTAPTSGGSATVALKLSSSADTLTATAIGSLTINSITKITLTPRTTAETTLTATVATAALTAGRFQVTLFWAPYQA